MATVKAFIRTSSKKARRAAVRFRVSAGRGVTLYYKSEITVDPDIWDNAAERVRPRAGCPNAERVRVNMAVEELRARIIDIMERRGKSIATSEDLSVAVDGTAGGAGFLAEFRRVVREKRLAAATERSYKVLEGLLARFEAMKREKSRKYALSLETFDEGTAREFLDFVRGERPRSDNYLHAVTKKLRAFFRELELEGVIAASPMRNVQAVRERYGTPYYLTVEERNAVAEANLSGQPALEAQRDIFVFHCCVGCRVSDLIRLTPGNVINGAIEYVPKKTGGERPEVVRVPLNRRAAAIVEKYAGFAEKDGRLMPFIASQKYNTSIKRILTLCGVTRPVTVLNPLTGAEERRPVNEVASSHLARRTFIGNLYKRVRDPNIIGAMSGHKEGSKAFPATGTSTRTLSAKLWI